MGQVYHWPRQSGAVGRANSNQVTGQATKGVSHGVPWARRTGPATAAVGPESMGSAGSQPGRGLALALAAWRQSSPAVWGRLVLPMWLWFRRGQAQRRRRAIQRRLVATLKPVGLGAEALEWLPELGRVTGALVDDGLVLDASQRRLERIWMPAAGQDGPASPAAMRLLRAAWPLLRISIQSLPIGPENRMGQPALSAEEGRVARAVAGAGLGEESVSARPGRWARLGVWIAPQLDRVYFTHHLWTPTHSGGKSFPLTILRGVLAGVAPYSAWCWDEQGHLTALTSAQLEAWEQGWQQMVMAGRLPLAVAVRPWGHPPARWAQVRDVSGAALLGLAELTNPFQPGLSEGLGALRRLGVRVVWQSQLERAVAQTLAAQQPGLELASTEETTTLPKRGQPSAERPERSTWLRLQWLPDGTLLLRWWQEGDLGPPRPPVAWRLPTQVHPLAELGKLCRLGQAFR